MDADPDLSRLDLVLERRVGLPINLAIIELEVAWRLGLALHGVGLPGHFIVGGPDGLLLDPAGGGRVLTRDDCQALIRRSMGDGVLLHAGMLRPGAPARDPRPRDPQPQGGPPPRARLGRVRWARWSCSGSWSRRRPTTAAIAGSCSGRTGQWSAALADLRQYLEEQPEAADRDDVVQVIGIFGGMRN